MKFLQYFNIVLAFVASGVAVSWNIIDFSPSEPWLKVVGNVHPLLLHLPIGGLVFLLLIELAKKRQWILVDASLLHYILLFTAFFANLSFFSGYTLSMQGGYPSELLNYHFYFAAAYVVFLTVSMVFRAKVCVSALGSNAYTVCLAGSFLCMGLTGHYGGLMTHGDPLSPLFEDKPQQVVVDKPTKQLIIFQEVVQPILAAKCYDCHGNGKSKGKLKLDTYEQILAGGQSQEKTLVPGDAGASLLISSLLHPLEHDKHMPPAKQTQLTAGEIQILKWWVVSGAQQKLKVAEMDPPGKILEAIENLVPEEVRAQREMARLEERARVKAEASQLRTVLHKNILEQIPSDFQAMLRFISPYSAEMHFSSVSLQAEFDDADFKKLKDFAPYLTSVDLSNSSIAHSSIQLLSECSNMHTLRLAGTAVTTADVVELTALDSLKTLSLHSTNIDASVFEHLAQMKSLSKLYLWSTRITQEELSTFQEAHPQIAVIY